jgi:hypothetical protein
MTRTTTRLVGLAILIVAVATPALAQNSSTDVKRGDVPRMLKIIDPQLLARMVELASSAKTCDIEAAPYKCVIEMTMFEVQVEPLPKPKKKFCVAVAPEVKVKFDQGGGGNKKKIVWELNETELDTKPLVFHEDAGIVITIDKKKQVDKKGKRGNGGAPVKHVFHTMTKRDKQNASATYLPVILWGPPGDEELCAAVDPKIVNY